MKTPGRKIRKQKRKNKQVASQSDGGVLKRLAKQLTMYRKYPRELANKKFYCSKCKKCYCITFIDTIQHCETCIYRTICAKEVRDIRDCENCEEV